MNFGNKSHINASNFRDCPGTGWVPKIVYRVNAFGGEKHINEIPPKMPGQSRLIDVYVFFLFAFCSQSATT